VSSANENYEDESPPPPPLVEPVSAMRGFESQRKRDEMSTAAAASSDATLTHIGSGQPKPFNKMRTMNWYQ
jgi:hypothetical protein